MNLEKIINTLKEFTISTKPFADTMNYFISSIAENPKARAQFKPVKDKNGFYRNVLEALFSKHHPDIKITSVLLMERKKISFIHGCAMLNVSKLCALYFFTDINMGMVMLSSFDGENDFYRITDPQIHLLNNPPIIVSKENHTIH